MLAAVVPADVHQFHRVERRAAAPWRRGAVRRLAFEGVFHRHQATAATVAPTGAEIRADVVVEHDVDVLEESRAHEMRLRAEQLLGHARPDHQRPRQLLALHDLLHRQRGDDVERRAGVVAFAVPRRALDERIVIRHARLLRALRDAVDVGPERNHRTSRAPLRDPGGWNAGHAILNDEAVVAQQLAEIALRLDFLEADLAEAEDHVVHLLAEVEHGRRRHVGIEQRLQLLHARIDGRGGQQREWAAPAVVPAAARPRQRRTRRPR